MMWALMAALAAAGAGGPAGGSPWTERYFGVGSGRDEAVACGEARDHAQGNSFRACVDSRGRRTDAVFTECTCASAEARLHVCNVNLKVSCERPSGVSEAGSRPGGGKPRGRAERRRDVPAKARLGGDSPGPEVSQAPHTTTARTTP